jgi:hypothetical protein
MLLREWPSCAAVEAVDDDFFVAFDVRVADEVSLPAGRH